MQTDGTDAPGRGLRVRVERCETEKAMGCKMLERFWQKVAITPGCWLWIAYKDPDGYGRFGIREGKKSTPALAHRISCVIHNGDIPDGLNVLHNCPDGDNPSCVNPDHLWLGTISENQQDMVSKNRQRHGGNYKLTTDQVQRAFSLRKEEIGVRQIAREIGINSGHASRLLRGKSPHSGKVQA